VAGGAFGPGIGQKIRVVLDPITTAGSTSCSRSSRGRYITKVKLRFDGKDTIDADLDGSSRTPTGQTLSFDSRTFKELEIEVTDLNVGARRLHGFSNAIGFAEVRVRDDATGNPVRVSEVVRMPTDRLRGRSVNRISGQKYSRIKGFWRSFESGLHSRRVRRIQAKYGFRAPVTVDETKLNPLIRPVSSRIVFKRCRAPGTTKGKGVVFAFVNTCPR
jgi:hypothetical protein